MARTWVRVQGTETITTTKTLANAKLLYQNSRSIAGNITLVQKATVVATHLFAITTTDDTWSLSLTVTDENRVPTYGDPEVADPELKGLYVVARGPVLYSPKRLIAIPSESSLYLRINKEEGGSAATIHWHAQLLINTSL